MIKSMERRKSREQIDMFLEPSIDEVREGVKKIRERADEAEKEAYKNKIKSLIKRSLKNNKQ